MLRGEVYWVSFDDSIGEEIQKTRPAIIISSDISNRVVRRVQVIPLTTNISKLYPCEAYVLVNGKKCKAMADQIVTASKYRLKEKIAIISDEDMEEVERAIKTQLDLHDK